MRQLLVKKVALLTVVLGLGLLAMPRASMAGITLYLTESGDGAGGHSGPIALTSGTPLTGTFAGFSYTITATEGTNAHPGLKSLQTDAVIANTNTGASGAATLYVTVIDTDSAPTIGSTLSRYLVSAAREPTGPSLSLGVDTVFTQTAAPQSVTTNHQSLPPKPNTVYTPLTVNVASTSISLSNTITDKLTDTTGSNHVIVTSSIDAAPSGTLVTPEPSTILVALSALPLIALGHWWKKSRKS